MRAGQYPVVRDLVLIGGGHAHALVARMWGMRPVPGLRLTLINPGPAAPYTGMLPGLVAGHYRRDEIMIDLVRLSRFAGARLVLDRVTGIDREAQAVHFAGRPPLAYDVASIDIGIASDLPGVPGFAEHGVAAKPLGAFAESWARFVDGAPAAPKITVIGGGIGGVELAMAAAHRLVARGLAPSVTVVERQPSILPHIGHAARARLLAEAAAQGITFRTGLEVTAIGAHEVTLSDGDLLPSDFTLAVAGTRAQDWLKDTGLALEAGFIRIGPTLQTSDPHLFAVGDCAHMDHAPRPKAGVFAVRQAPVLAHNLRVALQGAGKMRAYQPQRDYLKLVSCGGKSAVADKLGLRAGGPWVWRLKDRIDRRFMAMFAGLAPMTAPALPRDPLPGLAEAMGDKPLCGGCGSKLPRGTLSAALDRLPPPQRPEVLTGPDDDAAVIAESGAFRLLTTDHLRSFCPDARRMARIAAQHALSDIWAMGGAPEEVLAQITLPPLSPQKAAEDLTEIMEAAAGVIRAAGADLVGGHSSSGAELTIGFSVHGRAGRVIGKGGAGPGDALILTKPIGSGVIMAAEMAMAAVPGLILGEAVAEALALMEAGNGPAARLLSAHATAMTDVTGFGLAGHLMEMLQASSLAAQLEGAAIPLMRGARDLAGAGQGSSLLPANRAATLGRINCADAALLALLHDPQTSGGLLAAVPSDRADDLLAALMAEGIPAARIGGLMPGAPFITVT